MHELSLTSDMIEAISGRMKREPGKKVKRVVLEVGKLSAVLPDAFRFCFELCAKDSVADGAELEIIETQGVARCRQCGVQFATDVPYAVCTCGSAQLQWISGSELKIKHLEIE